MSSHREAPEISKDPVADNTDVYAFVSPDAPGTVTMIANFIPLEGPPAGPNFFEFGDDVLYEIKIDNDGDGDAEIVYQFEFHTTLRNKETFLYNTGQILSLNDPNWNKRQFYKVTRIKNGHSTVLGSNLPCPPCNIGPRSTPNYATLAQAAVQSLGGNVHVFAGQRAEGFYVDLGSVFDLLDLRPFENLHLISTPAAPGVNGTAGLNVHSIAIQVPIASLTRDGSQPSSVTDAKAVLGIWSSTSRQKVRMLADGDADDDTLVGPLAQVSRLGNPLFNEVIVPLGKKDRWNRLPPAADGQFLKYVQHPELAGLIPVLYPIPFPHLAALNTSNAARADLVAILLTGIPTGLIPGFQNYTGPKYADMLRLNVAIPPAGSPNNLGLLGGDLAGFPNGRRVADDVVTIELRAIAGVVYPLIDGSFVPDAAASLVTDGVSAPSNYLSSFPYLGVPFPGFS